MVGETIEVTASDVAEPTPSSSARQQRIRFWLVLAAAAVAATIVVVGGVSVWRGPGALGRTTGGNIVCSTPPAGKTGLFGIAFTNASGSDVTIQSVRVARTTNVKATVELVYDHRHGGGIIAAYVPDSGAYTQRVLRQSGPVHGFVIPPRHHVQVLVDLAAIDRARPGGARSTTVVYTEAGKPFSYESTSLEKFGVRPSGDDDC